MKSVEWRVDANWIPIGAAFADAALISFLLFAACCSSCCCCCCCRTMLSTLPHRVAAKDQSQGSKQYAEPSQPLSEACYDKLSPSLSPPLSLPPHLSSLVCLSIRQKLWQKSMRQTRHKMSKRKSPKGQKAAQQL